MSNLTQFLIGFLIGLVLSYACNVNLANGADFRIAALDELTISYKKYHESARHPLFYNSTPKESLNLSMHMDLLKYFGWDSTVQSMTNNAQYYMIGLQTKMYLRVSQHIDIGYYHQSQHLMDDKYPYGKFPVEDALMINLTIFRARPGRDSVF